MRGVDIGFVFLAAEHAVAEAAAAFFEDHGVHADGLHAFHYEALDYC